MEVKLLHYTTLEVADIAISKCYANEPYKEYNKQKKRINNVANVSKHSSTIEHLEYNFDINGISRACFSKDTEVMTSEGFKLFSELDGTEQVATRDESGKVVWQKPTKYHKYYKSEYLDRWKQQNVDLLVTKDHRMLYKKGKNVVRTSEARKEIHYEESSKINISTINFISQFNLDNKRGLPSLIEIEGDSYLRGDNSGGTFMKEVPPLFIKKKYFLQLLAIYLADGNVTYCHKENKYIIHITDSLEEHERIIDVFKKCGIHAYSDGQLTVRANSRQLGKYFKALGKSYEKEIPFNELDFSKEDAKIFIDTYLLHDGHVRKDNSDYCNIGTTSKRLANQIYNLILIQGYVGNLHIIDRIGQTLSKIKGKPIVSRRLYYTIDFSKKAIKGIEPTIRTDKHRTDEWYEGYVYCVTVPNGNLYVRRGMDSNPIWCGNCLQELARHRLFSFTVKSTRYTLQELKNEEPFCSYRIIDKEGEDNLEIYGTDEQKERASKYIYLTDVNSTDTKSISALELLRQEVIEGTKRDVAKYCLPECYKTSLTLTGNARVLQNFLSLRTDSHALLEIQKLAHKIYEVIPNEHKFLFEDYVKDMKEDK